MKGTYRRDMKEVWPCTIVKDRYGGVYSGAKWVAWPCDGDDVPGAPTEDDVTCHNFWHDFKGYVGKGRTPCAALEDLLESFYLSWEEVIDV